MFAVLGIMLRSTVTVVETNALTKTPMIPMLAIVRPCTYYSLYMYKSEILKYLRQLPY